MLLKQRCVSERDDGTPMRRVRCQVPATEAVLTPVASERRVQFLIAASHLARIRAAASHDGDIHKREMRELTGEGGGTVAILTIKWMASRTPSLPSGRVAITMSGRSLTVRRDAHTQSGRNDGGTI